MKNNLFSPEHIIARAKCKNSETGRFAFRFKNAKYEYTQPNAEHYRTRINNCIRFGGNPIPI